MLNVPETSTIHTDHKPLITFLNSDYHEDIFVRWAEKLRLLNVRIIYIKGERNKVADGLSRVLFYSHDCSPDQLVDKVFDKVWRHKQDQD